MWFVTHVLLPTYKGTQLRRCLKYGDGSHLLREASLITVLLMLLTMLGASLTALLPRWRRRGSPQNLPGDASSPQRGVAFLPP
jgi:hypothetical protein